MPSIFDGIQVSNFFIFRVFYYYITICLHGAALCGAQVYTDLSASACAVAEKAMQQNAVGSVELRQGDFFEPLEGTRRDVARGCGGCGGLRRVAG